MKIPTLKEFLDAGVHFGHQTRRWNPMMKPFVFMEKGGIHIIDLKKSLSLFEKALHFVRKVASEGGKMIFVGTKKQAVEPVKKAAQRCSQFYITKRWLGGTLTNFITIKSSVDRLKKIDQMREKGELDLLSKKEKSKIDKESYQLNEYLNGIREMKEIPSLLFVIDIVKERIAVKEAKKLKIPVIGIADTNCNPKEIDFPIPGNDDSIRSITLFSEKIADAYIEGEKEWAEKLKTESFLKEKEEQVIASDEGLESHLEEKTKEKEKILKKEETLIKNKKLKTGHEHHHSAEKMNPSTAQRQGKLSSKEYKEKSGLKKNSFPKAPSFNKKEKRKEQSKKSQTKIKVIQKGARGVLKEEKKT